jgi:hypothetical protein
LVQVRERGGDDVLFQSNLAPHLSLVHLKVLPSSLFSLLRFSFSLSHWSQPHATTTQKAILAISKANKVRALFSFFRRFRSSSFFVLPPSHFCFGVRPGLKQEVNADGEAAKEESVETLRERITILEEENQRLIGIIKDKNKIINDMFNREVELNEAAEQRAAATAGATKKGGGKVSSLLLATTPASRGSAKAKSSTKRTAKSERNVKHALTEWRREATTTTTADKKQTDNGVANTPAALEELPAADISLKSQGTGAQADTEPAPAAAVASLQLTESTERLRSRAKSADADKRTERLLMSKNHQVLKKDAGGDKHWTSAVLKKDSPQPSPSDAAAGDRPQTGKNESESDNERENEDKSEGDGGGGDGGEKDESEEAKRKRCEVFMHFQRQVSITNMALFAQKERQKMALMVEHERERDHLRRSAEKRQPQPQPPTESTNVDEAAKAELRPVTEDEQKEEEEKEKKEEVEVDVVEVEVDEEMEVEEKHRARVRNELIETEISYIHNLQILDAVRLTIPLLPSSLCHSQCVCRVCRVCRVRRVRRTGASGCEGGASGQGRSAQYSVRRPPDAGGVLSPSPPELAHALEPPPRELSTLLTLHQTFLSELQEADNSFTESFLSFIPFMKVTPSFLIQTTITLTIIADFFAACRCRE